ncbi:MAG: site-specific integrase, partial [Comamonas sp.]|uniref:site-specific integrase n=2 Tax=Comamonas sp. TaxID=34028 RepID=UPI002FC65EE9
MGRAAQQAAEPAPPLPAVVLAYLEHVRVEKRLAARTLTLYTLDLQKLLGFALAAQVELLALQVPHIRRFAAQMHSGGRSPRGIALILSGWRGFFVWAARQGLVPMNPVDGVRAPRAPKPLPKALGVEDALQLVNHVSDEADGWLEARDAAIAELLYSSGL